MEASSSNKKQSQVNHDASSLGSSTGCGNNWEVSAMSSSGVLAYAEVNNRRVNLQEDHHNSQFLAQLQSRPIGSPPPLIREACSDNYTTAFELDGPSNSLSSPRKKIVQFLEVPTRHQYSAHHQHHEAPQHQQQSESSSDASRRPDSFEIMRCKDPRPRNISWADTVAGPPNGQSGRSYRRSYDQARPMTPFPDPNDDSTYHDTYSQYSEFVNTMATGRPPSPSPPRQYITQIRRENPQQHVPQIRITDPSGATRRSTVTFAAQDPHTHRHQSHSSSGRTEADDPFPAGRIWGLIGTGVCVLFAMTSLMAAISYIVANQQTKTGQVDRSAIAWVAMSSMGVFCSFYALLVFCIGNGHNNIFRLTRRRNIRRDSYSSQRGELPLVDPAARQTQAPPKEYELRSMSREQGTGAIVRSTETQSHQTNQNESPNSHVPTLGRLPHQEKREGPLHKILKQPGNLAARSSGSEESSKGGDDNKKRESTLSAKTREILDRFPRPATPHRPKGGLGHRTMSAEPLLQSNTQGDELAPTETVNSINTAADDKNGNLAEAIVTYSPLDEKKH